MSTTVCIEANAAAPVRFTAPGLDLGFIFATLFARDTYIP